MTKNNYFTNDINVHNLENNLQRKYKKLKKGDSREENKDERAHTKQTE